VTIWLAGETGPAPAPYAPPRYRPPEPDLPAYRAAVTDLVASFERSDVAGNPRLAARVLSRRLADPDIAAVVEHTPQGSAGALDRLLLEVRGHRPGGRGSATSLTAVLRISLLAQIDALWWGRQEPYPTDAAVLGAEDLLDLDVLRQGGLLRFRYRHQAATLVARAGRSVERRALPGRTPMTAGLWLARSRPAAVALLNHIAAQFAERAPRGTPALWVTSAARSVEHQRRLRALGYAALVRGPRPAGGAAGLAGVGRRQRHRRGPGLARVPAAGGQLRLPAGPAARAGELTRRVRDRPHPRAAGRRRR
jgi:hypothetical protein